VVHNALLAFLCTADIGLTSPASYYRPDDFVILASFTYASNSTNLHNQLTAPAFINIKTV
jgi:hypothetical protein